MFLGLPDTPEVRDAKAHLLEGMVDRYEGLLAQGKGPDEAFGIAVGEFGSMEELWQELGGSCASAGPGPAARPVWDEDVQREYEVFRRQYPIAIAAGVVLCILGVIAWLMVGVWFGGRAVAGLNHVVLLCFVAVAVCIFVYFGVREDRFDRELFPGAPAKKDEDDDPISGAIMLGATAIYLVLGFTRGLWHPGWVVFLIGAAISLVAKVIWPHRG